MPLTAPTFNEEAGKRGKHTVIEEHNLRVTSALSVPGTPIPQLPLLPPLSGKLLIKEKTHSVKGDDDDDLAMNTALSFPSSPKKEPSSKQVQSTMTPSPTTGKMVLSPTSRKEDPLVVSKMLSASQKEPSSQVQSTMTPSPTTKAGRMVLSPTSRKEDPLPSLIPIREEEEMEWDVSKLFVAPVINSRRRSSRISLSEESKVVVSQESINRFVNSKSTSSSVVLTDDMTMEQAFETTAIVAANHMINMIHSEQKSISAIRELVIFSYKRAKEKLVTKLVLKVSLTKLMITICKFPPLHIIIICCALTHLLYYSG
jgi:hypothetical protein